MNKVVFSPNAGIFLLFIVALVPFPIKSRVTNMFTTINKMVLNSLANKIGFGRIK